MACPHFHPVSRFSGDLWIVAPRLPLNDAYRGVCRASEEDFEPSEGSQRELCNCGYARGRCERFPESSADAVRFSIVGESDGLVRVVCVMEREYAPAEHFFLEYSIAESRVITDVGEVVAAQAGAFLESYLTASSRSRLQ